MFLSMVTSHTGWNRLFSDAVKSVGRHPLPLQGSSGGEAPTTPPKTFAGAPRAPRGSLPDPSCLIKKGNVID